MILLLDVGNSAVQWALVDEGGAVTQTDFAEHNGRFAELADEYWSAIDRPAAVLACNVAGQQASSEIDAWCRHHWQIVPRYAETGSECYGVINAYPEPRRLGIDRWLTMLAVKGEFEQPVVIVDCGTAITIDVMTGDGRHQGGLIVPGISLMRQSLTENTPLDIKGRQVSDVSLFARDTLDAVLGGTLYMAAAFIDRVMEDVAATLDQRAEGIICGGTAEQLIPLLKNGFTHRPALVLEGLLVYAEECE